MFRSLADPSRCQAIAVLLLLSSPFFIFQEWFLERYHPKTEESKRYTKLKWIDQESAVFGKQLRANPRQFIASASLDPISEVNYCLFSAIDLLWMTSVARL